jgi:hypothetical protein
MKALFRCDVLSLSTLFCQAAVVVKLHVKGPKMRVPYLSLALGSRDYILEIARPARDYVT